MSDAFYFNLYAVPQFLVGFFMLAQGLVVLVQDYRSSLNRAFFLFELAVFVWLVGMGLAYISVGDAVKMRTLWKSFGADEQVLLSGMFSSAQRNRIKELITKGK